MRGFLIFLVLAAVAALAYFLLSGTAPQRMGGAAGQGGMTGSARDLGQSADKAFRRLGSGLP